MESQAVNPGRDAAVETPTTDAGGGTPTVYFDGACPLCQREIAFYRRLSAEGIIDWVDVSGDTPDEAVACDLDRGQALSRFHMRRSDGELVSGAAAFIALWKAMPGFRWLGWLMSVPPLPFLAELGYRGFLKIRPRISGWLRRREATQDRDPVARA